ncbi:RagB/SusD family nutrient uptake outer membrane protein [Olivibacter sp. 47]|uniref:RagB/SusD family nutrient uptake outer membrane protein n=1 Tax=Olivibacter sp. 47 TaxID=3056486 RepID=UPI0025A33E03|nr:RagB/SusD family nutrient uptake outer membrane protein [Olivibacter sp. 47]MDM8176643.1 RagB/SusD family nutrient uptake outer membrane protein [Olivibacter sp. 47]
MNKRYNIAVLFFLLVFGACKDDFLDRKPLDSISDADVWKDPALVQSYVNELYVDVWDPFIDSWKVMHTAITDEGMYLRDKGTDVVLKGTFTPENMGTLTQFGRWEPYYKAIRNCNLLFENMDRVPFTDEAMKNRLLGETYFLRAYFYLNLVSHFGGVSLITKSFGLDSGEEMFVERSSFEDCVEQIVADCDQAIALLPESYGADHKGRATKFSAMAAKSRILLYAASDLYNKAANSNALVGYVDGNRQERWQRAYEAAKDLLDNPGPHRLYQPTDSATENYGRVFLDNHNPEIIFAILHNKELKGTSVDLWNGPNGYHNWGGNLPIENFVSGYQKRDGSPFDWNNPEDAANPYVGRDPRFYASILYNGAKWRQRPTDAAALDPDNVIQTGRKEVYNASTNKIEEVWGVDTRYSPIENWNASITGYYTRKFLDINVDGQFFRGEQPWIIFRYAEILLNYAEAALALGRESEAREAINTVRTRAGMPTSTVSGQALVDLYRYERKYELAFEGHRYFDMRRWLIAESLMNVPAKGIDILAKLNADRKTYTYQYKIIDVAPRQFNVKGYFAPIPIGEIQKNPKLQQNPNF